MGYPYFIEVSKKTVIVERSVQFDRLSNEQIQCLAKCLLGKDVRRGTWC